MENFAISNCYYNVEKRDWHYENYHQDVNQNDHNDGLIGVQADVFHQIVKFLQGTIPINNEKDADG